LKEYYSGCYEKVFIKVIVTARLSKRVFIMCSGRMSWNLLVFLILICILVSGIPGCIEEVDPREDLSRVLGGIFLEDIDDDQISLIVDAIDDFACNDKNAAQKKFDTVLESINGISVSEVIIQPPLFESEYYRGLYCNDIRDARVVLAHIDQVKADGFDTVWIEVQYMVQPDGSFYIPGEEVYLFYLNAFHTSGLRSWISMGHTSYDFPYRWDKNTGSEFPPISSQREIFSRIEPEMEKWANRAEQFGVDTFILLEESNTLLLEYGANKTNLNQNDRDFLSDWHQTVLVQLQQQFFGRFGFATNDGGPLEQFEQREKYSFPLGPDFNYSGYNFIVSKIPFRNSFETADDWFFELDNRLESCNMYADRDDVQGVIWYEAGMPVGDSYEPAVVNHRILEEYDQVYAFEKTFEYAKKYNVSGIFFKLSPKQIHEGDWTFFDRSSEQILKDNFSTKGILEEKSIDTLWTMLGEQGLKVIQLAISPDVPFDPEYAIDKWFFDGDFQQLEQIIDGGCYHYDCQYV